MTNRGNILNELVLLNSKLGEISPENIYTVPPEYFEDFAEIMLNRIRVMDSSEVVEEINYLSPVLAGISKNLPYKAPDKYFEDLEEKLMQAIREKADYLYEESFGQSAQEELETISPLLSSISKQNPYSVPDEYFDSINEKKPAVKIVSITSRKWFRYAAAAVVTGIVATVALFFITGKNVKPVGEEKAWAKIEKKVEKLSDEEIKDFVEFNDAGLNTSETAGLQPVMKDELKELLKDVSDRELKDFLEQSSDGLDDISLLN